MIDNEFTTTLDPQLIFRDVNDSGSEICEVWRFLGETKGTVKYDVL